MKGDRPYPVAPDQELHSGTVPAPWMGVLSLEPDQWQVGAGDRRARGGVSLWRPVAAERLSAAFVGGQRPGRYAERLRQRSGEVGAAGGKEKAGRRAGLSGHAAGGAARIPAGAPSLACTGLKARSSPCWLWGTLLTAGRVARCGADISRENHSCFPHDNPAEIVPISAPPNSTEHPEAIRELHLFLLPQPLA